MSPTTGASTTSTTTLPTAASICVDGGTLESPVVTLGKLRGGVGDETYVITGSLLPAPGTSIVLDPAMRGMQLLLEDVNALSARPVLDLTASGTPIPPGAPGTGCDPKDGWKNLTYRNRSGALGPPECPGGSAQGLRSIHLRDLREKGRGIVFRVTGAGASLARPTGTLRLTLVVAADADAGEAGECASHTFAVDGCKARRARSRCK